MIKLKEEELKQINGGGFHIALGFLIGAVGSFLVGLVDGYIRPLACR